MVKVRTGRGLCACMSATTVEESIPPERNAPSGTAAAIGARNARPSPDSAAAVAEVEAGRVGDLAERPVRRRRGRDIGGAAEPEPGAGGELAQAGVDAARRGDVAVAEELRDGGAVDGGGEPGMGSEHLQLR